jgi:serine/threonine protein phosphatase PrpC
MEDTFFVSQRGDFTGVFDGHGGPAVSLYLRQNLYANLQAALPMRNKTDITVHDYQQALRDGLDKVDREVQRISHWSYQGSTAVAAWIHRLQEDNQSTLIVANVGDSRAILSRNSTAIALTHDHKPDSIKERERIEAQGGEVIWCGVVDDSGMPVEESGVYRVNGNLALSRAIGDRSERPAVTAEPEFTIVSLDEEAQFVVLATDGLWDVMTSQEVVQYINLAMYQASNDKSMVKVLRANMADFIVAEALRRGTVDNVTVVIVWLTS